jgi:hypothetical protein
MAISELPALPRQLTWRGKLIIGLYVLLRWTPRWLTHSFLRATAPLAEPGRSGMSPAETMVESTGHARAQQTLRRGARLLGTVAHRRQMRTASADQQRIRARWIDECPVSDPDGGSIPVRQAITEQRALQERIRVESAQGSRLHHRVSSGQRLTAALLPLVDLAVFIWFAAGVLNIDWAEPDPVRLSIAVALALLGTIAAAVFGHAVGAHLRLAKAPDGELHWPSLGVISRAMLLVTGALAVLLGLLMSVRVYEEAIQATGGHGLLPLALATALGVTTAITNGFIVYVGFADGSIATERLGALDKVTRPQIAARTKLLEKADVLDRQAALDQTRELRLRRRLVAAAGDAIYAAHQSIQLARAVTQARRTTVNERLDPNTATGPIGFLPDSDVLVADERVISEEDGSEHRPEAPAAWYPVVADSLSTGSVRDTTEGSRRSDDSGEAA